MKKDLGDAARTPPEGGPKRSEGPPSGGESPNPEVTARAKRRRFSSAYKSRILIELDACQAPGAVGALLRREGLYSSHIAIWRRQLRDQGVVGLAGKKRGPTPGPKQSPRELELLRENKKLAKRLAKAELVIEFQKKVHELLQIPLRPHGNDEDDS